MGLEAVKRDVGGGVVGEDEERKKDASEGKVPVSSMQQEANSTVEAEMKEEMYVPTIIAQGGEVKIEDAKELSSDEETGGHDEG